MIFNNLGRTYEFYLNNRPRKLKNKTLNIPILVDSGSAVKLASGRLLRRAFHQAIGMSNVYV